MLDPPGNAWVKFNDEEDEAADNRFVFPCNHTEFESPDPPQNRKAVPSMATVTHRTQKKVPSEEIPPLEPGDRLSRAEFERRYDAMPKLKKAELIEGEVLHALTCTPESTWAATFPTSSPGWDITRWLRRASSEPTTQHPAGPGQRAATRRCASSSTRPRVARRGSRPTTTLKGHPNSSPKLRRAASATTCTPSSRFIAAMACVSTWSGACCDREIDWFVLKRRKYVTLPLDENGLYRSKVFPGLWLDPAALIRGDSRRPSDGPPARTGQS